MKSENNTTTNGGIGFCGLLAIAFIVLKLTGFIHWSWLWVLSPVWIPLLIVIVIFVVLGLILIFKTGGK